MTQEMYHKYIKDLHIKISVSLLPVLREKVREANDRVKDHEQDYQVLGNRTDNVQHLHYSFFSIYL